MSGFEQRYGTSSGVALYYTELQADARRSSGHNFRHVVPIRFKR
jgi:hypothetical protein